MHWNARKVLTNVPTPSTGTSASETKSNTAATPFKNKEKDKNGYNRKPASEHLPLENFAKE
jgi:hypothetical protein